MANTVRVGIIGCGEAAQALHVPALLGLGLEARITAVTDASAGAAREVAARVGAHAVASAEELVRRDDVDVVLVATPDMYHADHVIAACEARKRAVLVEKPVATSARLARQIADASARTGTPVVVGYPHVYDPAVDQARRALAAAAAAGGPPRWGEFRSVLGPNPKLSPDVISTIRVGAPDPFAAQLNGYMTGAAVVDLLGVDVDVSEIICYALLTGLVSHDLPVMRRVFGDAERPLRVESARFRPPADPAAPANFGVDAMLVSGNGPGDAAVALRSGSVPFKYHDWRFTALNAECAVEVRYPITFAPGAPSVCTVTAERDGAVVDEVYHDRYTTGFRREWQHVLAVARGEALPETSAADAVRDMDLIAEITRVAVETARAERGGRPRAVTTAAVDAAPAAGVALVGSGFILPYHDTALRAAGGARTVAVASRSRAAAANRVRILGGDAGRDAYTFDEVDALVTRPDVDVVLVASPNRLHAEHALTAIRAGKTTLVEKPLALTLAEADAIVRESEARGVLAGYLENHVFAPVVVHLHAMAASGAVGRVRRVRGVFGHQGTAAGSWQRTAGESGGGSWVDLGSHAIATAMFLATAAAPGSDGRGWPAVRAVRDAAVRIDDLSGVDVNAQATYELENGVEVAVRTFWGGEPDSALYAIDGDAGRLEATLYPLPPRLVRYAADGTAEDVPVPGGFDTTVRSMFVGASGYVAQAEHFLRARDGQARPLVTAREGAETLRLIMAAYRAAARGGSYDMAEPLPADRVAVSLYTEPEAVPA